MPRYLRGMTVFAPCLNYLRHFHAEESGAATVDWVVGTAAAVTLGLAVTSSVSDGVLALSDRISSTIAGIEFQWVDETEE